MVGDATTLLANRIGSAMIRTAIDVCVAGGARSLAGGIYTLIVQAFAGAAIGGACAECAQADAGLVTLLIRPTVVGATISGALTGVALGS